jgi:hypothetical protein
MRDMSNVHTKELGVLNSPTFDVEMCDMSNVHTKELGVLKSPTFAVEISVDNK